MTSHKKSKHRSLNDFTIHPQWLTFEQGIVVKMAQTILNEGRFKELSYLADALEEAGCTDKNILDHCRQPHITHNENCIVLKNILGKKVSYDLTVLDNEVWRRVYDGLNLVKEYDSFMRTKYKGTLPQRDGFWTIPVIQGATCNRVVAYLRSLGVEVWIYAEDDDLDNEVTNQSRPNTQGSYLILIKANREADEELANLSADQLQAAQQADSQEASQEAKKLRAKLTKQGISLDFVTLLERLLLGAAYFLNTRKHLDQENWTLCAGSRDRDGDVPDVRWDAVYGRLFVYWFYDDDSSGFLCSRSVVSLPAQQA